MPNIEPNSQQSISDDQELAKVLAGVNHEDGAAEDAQIAPLPTPPPVPADDDQAASEEESASAEGIDSIPTPSAPAVEEQQQPEPVATPGNAGSELESVKNEALQELRPLVDKLNVSAEEKFDTYLLLLRSTDDKELIVPAHDAAREIQDEARRAQALLDIIKEIDFLSQSQQK